MNVKEVGEKIMGKGSHRLMVIGALASLVALYAVYRNRQAAAGSSGTTALDPSAGNNTGGGTTAVPTDFLTGLQTALQSLTDTIKSGGTGGLGASDKASLKLNYAIDTSQTFKTSGSTQGGGGSSGFNFGGGGFSLGFGSSSGVKKKTAEIDYANSNVFTNSSDLENLTGVQVDKALDFFKTIGGTYGQRSADQAANRQFANDQNKVIQSIVGTVKVKGQQVTMVNGKTTNTNTLHTATL